MKVVIIGGGIAGLTVGICLLKKNFNVVINERTDGKQIRGHAFLMHSDGLSILNSLSAGSTAGKLVSKKVEEFNLRRPDNTEIKRVQLNSWQCLKRSSLIDF